MTTDDTSTRISEPSPVLRRQKLSAPARLGTLYAGAVARSARLVVARHPAPATLPPVMLTAPAGPWDPERLAGYQRLVGEPGTDDVPAGYLHVLTFPLALGIMARGDFPLPLLGLVHVSNRVEQLRAVRFGERLELDAWADDLRAHRRGTQVDLVTTVRAGGEPVWQGTSTYLAKGTRLRGLEPPAPGDHEHEEVPQVEPHATWALSQTTTRTYAELSGDRNPIHLSRVAAKLVGFPRTIAHGMDVAARALAAVRRERGEDFSWQVRFAAPVVLPRTVALSTWPIADGQAFAVRSARRQDRGSKLHLHGSVLRRS